MKAKFIQAIKVLSSFAVIFMVLICTVAMPVLAAGDGNYKLTDLHTSYRVEGDNIIINYADDGLNSFLRYYVNDYLLDEVPRNFYEMNFRGDNDDYDKIAFYYYPLGVPCSQYMKSGLLDVSDLKEYSDITSSFRVICDSGAADTIGYLTFQGFSILYFFDENFNYINRISSNEYYASVDLTNQYTFDLVTDFELPANARYVGIDIRLVIKSDGFYDGGSLYFSFEQFAFKVSIDSVLENSLAMQDIKAGLADLKNSINGGFSDLDESINKGNQAVIDKIDEVIEGKDEWADSSQDRHDEQEDLEEEADEVMDSIDDGTDLDKILPDNAQTQEDLEKTINNWKGTNAWQQWKYLLSPIMNDVSIGQIMLMLVAFINIGVLLIGR